MVTAVLGLALQGPKLGLNAPAKAQGETCGFFHHF